LLPQSHKRGKKRQIKVWTFHSNAALCCIGAVISQQCYEWIINSDEKNGGGVPSKIKGCVMNPDAMDNSYLGCTCISHIWLKYLLSTAWKFKLLRKARVVCLVSDQWSFIRRRFSAQEFQVNQKQTVANFLYDTLYEGWKISLMKNI
jgi:hypothetical protein